MRNKDRESEIGIERGNRKRQKREKRKISQNQLQHKNSPEHLPDVILLDIYMPDLDGWGFLQEFGHIKEQLEKKRSISTSSARPVT